MDAIKVGIRVRPLIKREAEKALQWISNSNSIHEKGSSTPYYFDHVFGMESTNMEIFDTLIEPIIRAVMEGFNGTVFAYGQTSSGKTHTMMGGESDAGVIPLSIARIFEYIKDHPERDFLMFASFMEIYNEKLTDLLNPDNKTLKIREDSEHLVKVSGITEKNTESFDDIANLLRIGESFRSVGETQLNERSSRSHTIFTLTIESKLKEEKDTETDGVVKVATLNLVDLAGSERATAAGTEGVRFKEGTYINLSLLNLGNVISNLSNGSSHIPFRDSKLTRILQSSLGGNAKTCIVCTITPADIAESHSTLKFASRAMTIKNQPKVNEVLVGEDALLKRVKSMEQENMKLRKKLEEGLPADERHQLTIQLATAERDKNGLEKRLKALETWIKSTQPEKSSQKQSNRRMTVCCPRRMLSEDSGKLPLKSSFESTLLHPESPLVRRMKVSFPSGGGTGVGYSPISLRSKRGSLQDHSCRSQEIVDDLDDQMSFVTKRRKRVSFLPTVVSTPMHHYMDSLESIDSAMVDAQIQTDMSDWPIELVLPDVLSTEVQTEEQPLQSNCELQPVLLQTCEVQSIHVQTDADKDSNPSATTIGSTVHVQTDLGLSGEEELQKKVNLLTSELTTSKSEYDNIHSKWKSAQGECDEAYVEVAGLRKELLVLLQKLQHCTPTRTSAPSIHLRDSTALTSLITATSITSEAMNTPNKVEAAVSETRNTSTETENIKPEMTPQRDSLDQDEQTAVVEDENLVENLKKVESMQSVSQDSPLPQICSFTSSTPAPVVTSTVVSAQMSRLSRISSVKMESTPLQPVSVVTDSPLSYKLSGYTTPLSRSILSTEKIASSLRKKRTADIMSTLEFENDEHKMIIEDLQSQLEESQKMSEETSTKLLDSEDKAMAYQKRIADLESANVCQEELLVSLQAQLKKNQSKLEEMFEKNRSLEEQVSAREISVSNTEPYCVKEELARLQHELQEQKAGSSALQDKLNAAEVQENEHKLKAQSLEEEIKEVRLKLEQMLEQTENQAAEQVQEMHLKLQQKEDELSKQISGSNAELCCTKEELAKLQQELQEQQEGRSALQDKLSEAEVQENEHRLKAQSLEEELLASNVSKAELCSVNEELTKLQHELHEQQECNSALLDKLTAAEVREDEHKLEQSLEEKVKEVQLQLELQEGQAAEQVQEMQLKLQHREEELSKQLLASNVSKAELCSVNEVLTKLQHEFHEQQECNSALLDKLTAAEVREDEHKLEALSLEEKVKEVQLQLELQEGQAAEQVQEMQLKLQQREEELSKQLLASNVSKAELCSVNEELTKLQHEFHEQQECNSALQDKLTAAEVREDEHKLEAQSLEEKVKEVQLQLELQEGQAAEQVQEVQLKLQQREEELSKQLLASSISKAELNEELTKLQHERHEQQECNSAQQDKLTAAEVREDEHKLEAQSLEEKVEEVQLQLELQEEGQAAEQVQEMQLKLQLKEEELSKQMSLFDAERSSSMEELAKLRLEIERLLEENCALQDKLNSSASDTELNRSRNGQAMHPMHHEELQDEEGTCNLQDELFAVEFQENENYRLKAETLEEEVQELQLILQAKEDELLEQVSLSEEERNSAKVELAQLQEIVEKLQKDNGVIQEKLNSSGSDMELKFAKSEVSRLQQNLQDLQEGNHVLQDKLTEAEFQENESRQRIQSLEKKSSSSDAELNFAKSEVSRLQQTIQDLHEGNSVLQDKLTDAELQENESRQSMQDLEEEIQEVKSTLMQKENELSIQSSGSDMELNFAKSEVSRLQQNLQDLQEGNRALQVKLTDAEFEENESRQRIQILEIKISLSEEERNSAREGLTELKQMIEQLREDNCVLQEKLRSSGSDAELNIAKSEVSRLQQKLQELQEGNRVLQDKLTEAEFQENESRQRIQSLEKKISLSEEKRNSARDELTNLQQMVEELREDNCAIQEKLKSSSSDAELNFAKSEVSRLKQTIQDLHEGNSVLQDKLTDAELQENESRQSMQNLEEEIQEVKSTLMQKENELSIQVSLSDSKLISSKDEVARLQQELDKLREEKLSIQDKLSASDGDRSSVMKELDKLQREIQELQEGNYALQDRLSTSECQENEARHKAQILEEEVIEVRMKLEQKESQIAQQAEDHRYKLQQKDEELSKEVQKIYYKLQQKEQEFSEQAHMFDKEFSIAEEKLSNLEQEIKKLQEEKRDMEERLRSSAFDTEQLSCAKNQLAKLQQEYCKLQENSSASGNDLHRAKSEVSRLLQELREVQESKCALQEKLTATEFHERESRQNAEKFEKEVSLSDSKLISSKDEVARLQQELDKLREEKLSIQDKVIEIRTQLEQKESQIAQKAEDHRYKLQQKDEELSKEVQKIYYKLHQKEQEVSEQAHMFDKEFSIAEEKLSNLEQEIKKLQEENREMEERLKSSAFDTEQLSCAKNQLAKLQQEYCKLQENSSASGNDLHRVKSELSRLLQELREVQESNCALQEKLTATEFRERGSRQNAEKFEKEVQKIYYKLHQKEQEVSEQAHMFDKEFSIAEEKLSNLEQEIKKLQEENHEMEERLKSSAFDTEQLSCAKNHLAKLQQEYCKLQENSSASGNELHRVESELSRLLQKLREMQESNCALQEKLTATEFHERESRQNAEKFEKEKSLLDDQLSHAKNEMDKLKQELEAMQEDYFSILDKLCTAEFHEEENRQKANQLEKELSKREEIYQQSLSQFAEQTSSNRGILQLQKQLHTERKAKEEVEKKSLELRAVIDRLQADYQTLYSREERTCAMKDKQQAELESLQEENFTLLERITTAEFYENQNKIKAEKLEKEIQEMQQKLLQKDKQLSNQVLSSDGNKENLQLREVLDNQSKSSKEAELQSQVFHLKEELEGVTKECTALKRKLQGMATVPKMSTGSIVDGSGAVTGLAFHQLQQELAIVKAEKEDLKSRTAEATKRYNKYRTETEKERTTFKTVKNERNVYRTKYACMKDTCTCGASKRMKQGLQHSGSSTTSDPSMSSAASGSSVAPSLTSTATSTSKTSSDSIKSKSQKFVWNQTVQEKEKKNAQDCKTQ